VQVGRHLQLVAAGAGAITHDRVALSPLPSPTKC
jgi:hypothetical protein